MHIRTVITRLGYSPHETSAYLAALELGGSSITEIAAKARLPRTTANAIIRSLQKKGLINAYLKKRRKIWVAENPEKLLIALKESETALKMVLPELQSLRHDTGVKPTVRTYTGADEIKQILQDIIESKHHISALLPWDEWVALLGKNYLDDFTENRHRHYLRIRLLTPKSKITVGLKQKDSQEMRVTQFLPESLAITNANFIYANKVAIISLNKTRPVGILIEDEGIHHTMEVFFENMWNQNASDR